MTKPIMNLDEVTFDDVEENGIFTSSRALFSAQIGARKLGYNLTVLPPGADQAQKNREGRAAPAVLSSRAD